MRPPDREAAASSLRRWMAAVFVAACAVYAISLFQGFVFDDLPTIVKNSHVRSLRRLPEIFGSTYWAGAGRETPLYRPVTIASYAVNYAVVGLSPWGYHATNVLLHAGVAALLLPLALSLGLSLRAGAIGAFCFAVHPLHVEAVTSVVGRAELLAALFVSLSLLLHPWAARGGRSRVLLPALTFLLALFSKESAISFMALVVLRDLLRAEGRNPRFTLVYLGYGAALLLFVAARSAVVSHGPALTAPFVDNPAAHATGYMRLLTAVGVLGKGLWLHVWPASLSADYSFDSIPLASGLLDPRVLGSLLALSGLLAAALLARRSLPFLPTAWGWYLLALLPASNLLFPIGTIFGERLLYLPSVAFCLAAGLLSDALWRRTERRARAVLGLLILVGAGLATQAIRYSAAWADAKHLFSAAVLSQPRSVKAHYNLGAALRDEGHYAEAEVAWKRALAIYPAHVESLGDLGSLHLMRGELGAAKTLLERAVRLAPERAAAWYNLGLVLQKQGDVAGARRALSRFAATGAGEFPEESARVRSWLDQASRQP